MQNTMIVTYITVSYYYFFLLL